MRTKFNYYHVKVETFNFEICASYAKVDYFHKRYYSYLHVASYARPDLLIVINLQDYRGKIVLVSGEHFPTSAHPFPFIIQKWRDR